MFCSGFLKEDICRDFPRKTEIKDLMGINFLEVRDLLGHLRHRFKSPEFPQVCFSSSRGMGEKQTKGQMCKSAKKPNSDVVPACGNPAASQEVIASSSSSPE